MSRKLIKIDEEVKVSDFIYERKENMTVGEIKAMNLPDNTEIKINSLWNENEKDLNAVSCDGFYHEKDDKIYLTPDIISI